MHDKQDCQNRAITTNFNTEIDIGIEVIVTCELHNKRGESDVLWNANARADMTHTEIVVWIYNDKTKKITNQQMLSKFMIETVRSFRNSRGSAGDCSRYSRCSDSRQNWFKSLVNLANSHCNATAKLSHERLKDLTWYKWAIKIYLMTVPMCSQSIYFYLKCN